jgi:ubiquinone/menaquinone biosynthesis C-methylase UbiE
MTATSKTRYLKELETTYTKIAEEYLSIRDNMVLEPELVLFSDLLNGPNVLDAGCGPGRDARFFVDSGLRATGIDLTKRFILMAKQRVPDAHFRVMNILDLKFKECSFNGIWCCAVLSHIRKTDVLVALSELHRVLEYKGILFASVKAGTGERKIREPIFDNHPRFTSFYRKNEILRYLKQAGFIVLKAYTFNERDRFGQSCRDLDYITTFSIKSE